MRTQATAPASATQAVAPRCYSHTSTPTASAMQGTPNRATLSRTPIARIAATPRAIVASLQWLECAISVCRQQLRCRFFVRLGR